LTYKVKEATTFVAYAVEDSGKAEKAFGLVMIGLQLDILRLGVATYFSEVECPVFAEKVRE